jgi:hypothetical protein
MQSRARRGLRAAAALVLSIPGWAAQADGFVSAYRWSTDDPLFGGFSAVEIAADGTSFIALSDRGAWTEGTLQRDADGAVVGVAAAPLARLKAGGDAPLGPERADSEGVARAPNGTIYIAFEGATRVLRYADLGGSAINLPDFAGFHDLPTNASLEALAIDEAGTLFAIAEDTRGSTGGFPVFRYDGAEWSLAGTLPRDGTFLPVAADFGPDGRLYVLERDFRGLLGFASRVRSYGAEAHGFDQGETAMQSTVGSHDNLEGLAVWQDQAGAIRLTMISDDNFKFYQRAEFVDYRLGD